MWEDIKKDPVGTAVVVAFLIFLGWAGWQSSEPQRQRAEYSARAESIDHHEISADDGVADYTWWLAVLTGALVAVSTIQGVFLLRVDKTARITANAADRSARAAVALQLPIIRIRPDSLGVGALSDGGIQTEYCSVDSMIISNLGATKAFPKEIAYGWTIGDELPDEPSYRFVDSFLPNFILDADPKITQRKFLQGVMPLEAGQWSKICEGNYLWFYCSVLYEDFMGENRSHGFCWRWAPTGMGMDWRLDDTAAYNRKTYKRRAAWQGMPRLSRLGTSLKKELAMPSKLFFWRQIDS